MQIEPVLCQDLKNQLQLEKNPAVNVPTTEKTSHLMKTLMNGDDFARTKWYRQGGGFIRSIVYRGSEDRG